MKKLFLFLGLIFILVNSKGQFDSSWNNTNADLDLVKNVSYPYFIYKNIRYPIFDLPVFKKYGSKDYAESFYDTVKVDSSVRHLFSPFLWKDQLVLTYKQIINGQLKNETEYKDSQVTWRSLVVSFLFFVLLPILFYCFKYVDLPGFNIIRDKKGDEKGNWYYFSLLILIGPMLMFGSSYVALLFLQKTIYIHYLPFLSSTLYYFFTSVICLVIVYMIWMFNSFKGLIILPLIIAQSCIVALLGGIYTREISIVSLFLIMMLPLFIPDFINGFIFGVVNNFQRLRKKK